MERVAYFNHIQNLLGQLSYQIKIRGSLNLLDLNIHAENFYMHFLNLLYGWNLENMNLKNQNMASIDLIDHTNHIIIQVSATATKHKVESAIGKAIMQQYEDYTFKFLSIAVDAASLRKKTYKNPHKVTFDPSNDIIDNASLLKYVDVLDIDHLIKVQEFICKELGKGQTVTMPKWITSPCKTATPHYIERPEYRNTIDMILQHHKVLLHGMGGLGKTECMRKICGELSDSFKHVAWIQYAGSLQNSLTSQIKTGNISELPEDRKYATIKRMLTDMGKDLLLFVDNITAGISDDPELSMLETLEGTVILSARPPHLLTSYLDVSVDQMNADDCKKLFYAYSEIPEAKDEEPLEGIIALAGRHTLTLEIIAKAAGIRKMLIPEMLKILKANGFNISVKVLTAYRADKPEALLAQLTKLYDISSIRDKSTYLHILKNFAVLPYLPLSKEDTIAFLKLDEDGEQALYDLSDLGWLELSDVGFTMHPVIRQVLQQESVSLDVCRAFISDILIASDDYFAKVRYLHYIEQIATHFQVYDPLVAAIQNKLSTIYQALGKLPEALEWQLKAKEIREALYTDGKHPNLAMTYNNLSTIYQDMGKLPEALEWQLKAKEIREDLYPDGKHPDLATTYNNLSTIYQDMGKLPEALEWQLKAIRIYEALYPDGSHPALATTYSNLSLIYKNMGKLPEALEWQLKAIRIYEALYPDGSHPALATTYSNLSLIYKNMGKLPEALEWQQKAKEIQEALYPDGKHPDLATMYSNLSLIYKNMGKLLEALEWQQKAKEIQETLYPDGRHPDLATTYNNLSLIYKNMGKLPEALEWQQKAKKIWEALYPDGRHPALATTYSNLSLIYQDMGKLPEALEWQLNAKEIREALYPDGNHPDLATMYSNLSTIYYAMGKLPEALEWQLKAKEIKETFYPDGKHPALATTYSNLAMIYQDMGKLPEALDWQLKDKKISEALYPDGRHPALATTYNNLSTTYYAMGKFPEAFDWQQKAKEIQEALYPDGRHPSLVTTYSNLAMIYRAMGKLPEAHKWQQKAESTKL